jgi:hypothetical protein
VNAYLVVVVVVVVGGLEFQKALEETNGWRHVIGVMSSSLRTLSIAKWQHMSVFVVPNARICKRT